MGGCKMLLRKKGLRPSLIYISRARSRQELKRLHLHSGLIIVTTLSTSQNDYRKAQLAVTIRAWGEPLERTQTQRTQATQWLAH